MSYFLPWLLFCFPGGASGKAPTCQCRRHGFSPCVGKIAGKREWQSTPRDLPDLGIEPRPPALQSDSLLSEPPGKPLGTSNLQLVESTGDSLDLQLVSEVAAGAEGQQGCLQD